VNDNLLLERLVSSTCARQLGGGWDRKTWKGEIDVEVVGGF
jgi:hypothetical protein